MVYSISKKVILHEPKLKRDYRLKIDVEITPKTCFSLRLFHKKFPLEGEDYELKIKATNLSDVPLPPQEQKLMYEIHSSAYPQLFGSEVISLPRLIPNKTETIHSEILVALISGGCWINLEGKEKLSLVDERTLEAQEIKAAPQFLYYILKRGDIFQIIMAWLTVALIITAIVQVINLFL